MTTLSKDEVIAMAREAGATIYTNRHYPGSPAAAFSELRLIKFATLCRADLVAELAELRLQLITSIGETQAALEKMDALRQAYGLMHGSSK